MAVGQNLDRLFAALKAGISANYMTSYNPIEDPAAADHTYDVLPGGNVDSNPEAFIWGPHKWGSKIYKATK